MAMPRRHAVRCPIRLGLAAAALAGLSACGDIRDGDLQAREAPTRLAALPGGASRVFASGLRNPVGLAWTPGPAPRLWTVVNERDELGSYLVDNRVQPPNPVGVAQDASGALLVADDVGNVVWRVTHQP
jgi:glucose/arabinose dehydrogenase